MNFYFTYESRSTLKSFIFFIAVKIMAKLNLGHDDKSEIKISRCGSRSPGNAEFGHFHVVVLQRKAKKCTKNYNARAQPLFCSLILLFSDVPVTVAVVVS